MNNAIFNYLNSFAGKTAWLDNLIVFFGQYLAYVLVLAFLIIVFKNKNWRLLKIGGVSVFLSRFVITEIIRFFYFVPRPFFNNPAVHQLIFNETSGAFPSGHAAIFFALAMAIWLVFQGPSLAEKGRSFSVIFFAGAILMGIARVMAGVHWPLDILGGAIIGIFSAWLVCKISGKIYNKA